MMDIFGLGTRDKDIIISLGAQSVVEDMMANFSSIFESHSKYGGLKIIRYYRSSRKRNVFYCSIFVNNHIKLQIY